MSIKTDQVDSVHYRSLATTCLYCPKRSRALRITVMRGRVVLVAALCKAHSEGEMESVTQGMRNDPGTSDFYSRNPEES